MATKKKVLPKVPKAPDYHVVLQIGSQRYESSGETMLDALNGLEKPPKITLRGYLTVSRGEKSRSQLLNIPRLRRLFFPIAKVYHAKRLSVGL